MWRLRAPIGRCFAIERTSPYSTLSRCLRLTPSGRWTTYWQRRISATYRMVFTRRSTRIPSRIFGSGSIPIKYPWHKRNLTKRRRRAKMKVPYDVVLPQVSVMGSTMAYREAGNPDAPVALFLHGNPTSSYIWRNIIPLVAPTAHCIAPDLIGFGQSGKPYIEYRFADHVRYLDAFLANAEISSAFVIAQDCGTALAFQLAARRPEFIRGLAFMEFLWPMPTWENFPAIARETFQKFRTPGVGEKMILEGNAFVEGVLPLGTVRKLTHEEMSVYRAPFPTPESRRPTWRFPNELPIAGEPADVHLTLEKAHRALAQSSYPKVLFAGNPGGLISPAFAESFAKGLKNCRVVQLGSGIHYLQEDHPEVIGAAVREWLIDLGIGSSPKHKVAS